jgi:uncharacterized protein
MDILISEIKKQPGLSTRFQYKGYLEFQELILAGDLDIDFKLTNAASRVLVDGKILADVRLECSRCLEEFVERLNVPVHEQFLPPGSPELEDEIMDWNSITLFPIEDDKIDVSEVIRQNILAAIPIKPLCRPDCPGIIIEGEEEEGAEESPVDPRFEALEAIKRKAEGK